MSDLVRVQEIRWERQCHGTSRRIHIFLLKGKKNHTSDIGFFVHRDMMSYITLKCRWCHIIVLNVHAPTEDKTDYVNDGFHEELTCMFEKFPKYHLKVLLGEFNAKVDREGIFKSTTENERLHKISNDNGVRLINFATSKNLTVKSTMFAQCTIHKYTCTSSDGKTHNQTVDIMTDR
jgi:hypothetical protein